MSAATAAKVASLLQRNQKYAETYKSPGLLMEGIRNRPAGVKGTVIISCSDPRIHPEQFLGLNLWEAAIIRNGGGRTRDVMRTLLTLDAVGRVGTVIIVHHTDCGMCHTDEKGFQASVEERHKPIVENQPGFVYGAISDPEKTVVEDVKYLRSFPTLAANMDIVGLVLDTHTGILKQIDV